MKRTDVAFLSGITEGLSSKKEEFLQGNKNGYIAADNIEIGYDNKIPLWLFGFLY
ncbi:MAG: hypothetical protein ACP5D3_03010 [Sulfurovum sp.]